mmetsp:Transcript_4173/g.11993  ORF Transcript_4173/g.11993 Transcript_4173/m.11993 type:complete len:203 (+) Transcript_4173:743-1351(+)
MTRERIEDVLLNRQQRYTLVRILLQTHIYPSTLYILQIHDIITHHRENSCVRWQLHRVLKSPAVSRRTDKFQARVIKAIRLNCGDDPPRKLLILHADVHWCRILDRHRNYPDLQGFRRRLFGLGKRTTRRNTTSETDTCKRCFRHPECSCLPRHNNSGPQEKHDLTYARHPFLRPSHVNAFGITAAITAEREEGSHHEAACA